MAVICVQEDNQSGGWRIATRAEGDASSVSAHQNSNDVKSLSSSLSLINSEGPKSIPFFPFSWADNFRARGCIETLARSLEDDPLYTFFCGRSSAQYVRDEVEGFLRGIPNAKHFLATQQEQAVALWHHVPDEMPQNELLTGWKRFACVHIQLWRALLVLEAQYDKHHTDTLRTYGPFYYLSFLGTAEAWRGKGLGSHLIRAVTKQADAEQKVCFVEATNEANKRLYQHHGFILVEEYCCCRGAPAIYFMLRQPTCGEVGSVIAANGAVNKKTGVLETKANANPGAL